MLFNFPCYFYNCSLLLSTPFAPIQKKIHVDFVAENLDVCFTCIISINMSANFLLFDKEGNSQEYNVACGKYLRFNGQRPHCGGRNDSNCFQFRIQILFAKRKEHLPPFDTFGPVHF